MKKKIFLPFIIIALLFVSCFEDLDDNFQPASTLDIQNFVYRGLNFFYLYKADVPELANDAFENDEARNSFLSSYDSPESLFDYLTPPHDEFSRLFADYTEIENALNGISLSNGMEFGLIFYPDNFNVFGYVRYVLPNTDAESKGIQRGFIFNTIDEQQITVDNYEELLSPNSYSIGLATFDGSTITPTGESITLAKSEYTENPVYIAETLTVNGQKIGYLMYNSFVGNFDSQLNAAFSQFKADGVTNLILDLRYNGGGSVETATDLASMITGQFNGQIFYTEQWNADRQDEYASNGLFDNTIGNGDAINSLNLGTVYVITTESTASASELVLNGLEPYIDAVQVGDSTTGKYQASILLYDAPAPSFSKSAANPNHKYVMLPLVFKTANAAGNTDYNDGLFPDVLLHENYTNIGNNSSLGQLGDISEPLLAAAINEITPLPVPVHRDFRVLKEVSESKAGKPLFQLMVAEK